MIYFFLALMSFYLNLGQPKQSFKQPKHLTEISTIELAKVLHDSHLEVFGREPSTNKLAVAWAQVALENGQGRKVYNYNLGNIGTFGLTSPYYTLAGHKFLANSNFMQGGRKYWETLKQMCPSSLAYFEIGDPQGAALQLRRCGYYRASSDHYSKLMRQLFYVARFKILNKVE